MSLVEKALVMLSFNKMVTVPTVKTSTSEKKQIVSSRHIFAIDENRNSKGSDLMTYPPLATSFIVVSEFSSITLD